MLLMLQNNKIGFTYAFQRYYNKVTSRFSRALFIIQASTLLSHLAKTLL